MKNELVGKKLSVHSYKHNGTLYRRWDKSFVLEDNKDYLVVMNDKITISNLQGKTRRTNEPALWFFPKGEWFNFICMLRGEEVFTYVNIASDFLIEEGAIKYVDYDLDFKIYSNKRWRVLDKREYDENKVQYSYPKKLQSIIESVRKRLQTIIVANKGLVSKEIVQKYFKDYFGGEENTSG